MYKLSVVMVVALLTPSAYAQQPAKQKPSCLSIIFGGCGGQQKQQQTDPALLSVLNQNSQTLQSIASTQAQMWAWMQSHPGGSSAPSAPRTEPIQYVIHYQAPQGVPQWVSPSQVTPQYIPPSQVVPQAIQPSQIVPQYIPPSQVAPQQISPYQVPPQVIQPQQVAPQVIVPGPNYTPPQSISPNGTLPPVSAPPASAPPSVSPPPSNPPVVQPPVVLPPGVNPPVAPPVNPQLVPNPQPIKPAQALYYQKFTSR